MISPNSLAAGVGSAVKNVQFQSGAFVLSRKIGIVATYDPALTGIVPNTPVLITSPADAGDKFGFGFMAHRLALKAFAGSNGVPTYVLPQAEAGGSTQAEGSIDFTVTTVQSGVLSLYIGGELVSVAIPATISGVATTADDVVSLVADAINADSELSVTSAINVTPNILDITAKSTGGYGNKINLSLNLGFGQELPGGVQAVIANMSGGAGVPDISEALELGLGTGEIANELHITDLVHGYGLDTATLDALSTYNGTGNEFEGLYAKLVARPFRALTGDTDPTSSALSAIIAIADTRLQDRTNGVICAPGSQSHPYEIASQAIGVLASVNNNLAEQSTIDQSLNGVWPGEASDQWTAEYSNRDLAVKSGVGTTLYKNAVMTIQNLVTFYRPANVDVNSNGYRSMRNISILQNILNTVKVNFSQEKWQGISIVKDTNNVGSNSKRKARDTGSLLDDLVALATSFESNAWIYSADYTIDQLALPGAVVVRPATNGFDSQLKVILSGEGGILDTQTDFDTSIAVTL